MTQLTMHTQQGRRSRTQVSAPAARRTMRHTRMVSLRTPMPLGLVTLRHDVPEWLGHDVPDFHEELSQTDQKNESNTTSKVVLAAREVETTARRAQ